jgi:hypothetical protein
MNRTKLINHKGITIFYMDFSNIKTVTDISSNIDESIAYIRKQPQNSVFGLTNLDTMFFNIDVKNMFTTFLAGNKPFMKKSAVFGISGLARILFNGLMKITGRDVRSFEKMEDAKEFLVNK